MKLNKTVLAIAMASTALLSSLSFSTQAATTVEGGTIKFKGTVVNAACAVDAGDTNKEVNMGQVRLAEFGDKAGTPAQARYDVNIKLLDCDTTVSATAAVTFKGTGAGGAYSNVLKAGIGGDSATGIGIQLFDTTGDPLALGAASKPTNLTNGTNTLHYQAGYISTADAPTAGNADAIATFTVTYA